MMTRKTKNRKDRKSKSRDRNRQKTRHRNDKKLSKIGMNFVAEPQTVDRFAE